MAVSKGRMPLDSRPTKLSLKKVGAMEMPSKEMLTLERLVTPMGMPMTVVTRMPMNRAPLTFQAIRMPVMIRPISASRAGPEVMLLRSSRLLPAVTMPAFSRPIRQMNRPIPALMAAFRGAGMESMICLRIGETEIARKIRPEMNTIARPCCQV